MTFGDVGTVAVVGGVLGESMTRLARTLGREPAVDGWREGMFAGASLALAYWIFWEVVA